MKGLRARVAAGYGISTISAITLLMSDALGQATPDSAFVIPEPSILPLLGAGVAMAWLFSKRRK
jgi:hypothetical protein